MLCGTPAQEASLLALQTEGMCLLGDSTGEIRGLTGEEGIKVGGGLLTERVKGGVRRITLDVGEHNSKHNIQKYNYIAKKFRLFVMMFGRTICIEILCSSMPDGHFG